MNKYENGKIYKITNTVTDDIYVGSTIHPLSRRFSDHKCFARKEIYQNIKLYKLMNDIGFDKFSIALIEDFPCETKTELCRREGYFIYTLNTSLNQTIAGRTRKEWKVANPDKVQAYNKKFYEKHKEKIQAQARVAHVCECGGTYCTDTKRRHLKSIKHMTYMKDNNLV